MHSLAPISPEGLVIGVDTHKDRHVAVALSGLGVKVATTSFATNASGLASALRWAEGLGPVAAWGVEGTASYGAGLNRELGGRGATVVEVNRPDRRARRVLGGKSDPIDAEAAARSVLSGFAITTPKAGDGRVELLRMARATKASAVKASTAAMNQLRALLVGAPPALRDELSGLTTMRLVRRCVGLRPSDEASIEMAIKRHLRGLAKRWLALQGEVKELKAELEALVGAAAPGLLAEHGVGPDTAAALLISAGDNHGRMTSEAAFAALAGVSPIPASSGKTDRHRLNRGGDRQANAALHRIVVVRLKSHSETRDYMAAHVNANGSNKRHVMRSLKRYLARRLFPLIRKADTALPETAAEAA